MVDEFPAAFLAGVDPDLPQHEEAPVRRRSFVSRLFRRG